MRPYYLTPFLSSVAAYCFTHPAREPSVTIAIGVFCLSCIVVIIARTIAVFELQEYVEDEAAKMHRRR